MHWNAVNRMLIYAVCSACASKKNYLRCFDFCKFGFTRKKCVMFCFASLTCCAASQCKQKKQHIAVLQTLVYFDPPLNDVIQETDHRLLTGYNKPIIDCEKNRVSHPYQVFTR